MAFNIAYTYQLIDRYTAPLKKIIDLTERHKALMSGIKGTMRGASNEISHMANRVDKLNNSMASLNKNPAMGGGRMSRFGAAMSGLSGLGGGMAMSGILQQTATVENAMIDLGRATDLPAADLRKFEDRFMTLSEKIGITTDKLAIMAFEGSKMGLKNDELDKFVKITANAAVSFEILEDEAGRALGSIKAKLGMNIGALQELMDRVNFVADATSADGKNMIEIIERLSGTFKTLKVPPEVAAGFAAVADQLETSPELAASGMNMVINKMMKSSVLAEKMFKAPAETMRGVFAKLAAMPEAKRIAAATKMFGDEAGRFAVKLAGNMSLFDETMKKAAESKALGSMEREMDSKLKSLSMLWRNLKNGVLNVMVAIGEGLAPDIKRLGDFFRELTPKVREFVREHPMLVKIAMAGGAILAAFALAAPIVWALGAAFSFVGAAVGLLSLPIVALIGLAAGIALKWSEWTESGHPLVVVVGSIYDRISRLLGGIISFGEKSGITTAIITALSDAFDFLGVVLAIPLQMLDQLLWVIEKIAEIIPTIDFGKIASDAGSSALKNLMPTPIRAGAALAELAFGGGNAPQEVNGTITVKAEPGTKAKVQQPSLPTGSNVRIAQ